MDQWNRSCPEAYFTTPNTQKFDFLKLQKIIRDFLDKIEQMKTIDIRQISKIPEIRRVEGPKDSYKCLFCQNKPKSNLGREKKHIHFIQHMQICNGNRGKLHEEFLWNVIKSLGL